MRRNALAICIALALLLTHPLRAAACSLPQDFDPCDYTQLLVLGRARSIELGARTALGIEATVTLEVVHTFRGATASPLRFVDSRSVFVARDPHTGREEIQFAGGAGGCGTIDDDPVGQFVLIALAKGEDSRWHLERHGVAVPFLITGPAPDVALFGAALAP